MHSPLVGPTTWRWVAEVLVRSGHEVTVPDLVGEAATGDPVAFVEAARRVVPSRSTILVGHSGAGFFLPLIGAGADGAGRPLVFVDAVVPPCDGVASPSGDFLGRLRELARDGVLPRWSTWWGEEAMARLVPDADRRGAIEAEMPTVPLGFYEQQIAVPAGWCDRGVGYFLLSEAYRRDAEAARARGWTVVERDGTHLDLVTEPEIVAAVLLDLAARLLGGPGQDLEAGPDL